jgi:hypothetical protein
MICATVYCSQNLAVNLIGVMKTVLFIQAIIFQQFLTATISLVRRARFASVYLVRGMYSLFNTVQPHELRPLTPSRVYSLQQTFPASAVSPMIYASIARSNIDGYQQSAVDNCNFNSTPSRLLLKMTRIFSEEMQHMRKLFSGIPANIMPQSGLRAKAVRLHEESNCNSFFRKTDPDRTD